MRLIGRDDKSITIGDNNNISNSFNTEKNFIKITVAKSSRIFKKVFFKKKYYKDLEDNINNQIVKSIEKQKNNKKYIPDIFLELNDTKENLRYLSQPVLFYKKILAEVQKVNFIHFNNFFKKVNLPEIKIEITKNLGKGIDITNVSSKANRVNDILNNIMHSLPNLHERKDYEKKLPAEQFKLLIKEEGTSLRIKWILEDFINRLDLIEKKRIVILTERAGQGKTNLVCDFAETILERKRILGVLLFGNQFNNIDRDNIETIILQNIFGFEQNILFNDFLTDVEHLCKKNNYTFNIIIDGLNENSNIKLFSTELYNFIEKILNYRFIRIILTCRSEYFKERFNEFIEPSFKDILLLDENYMKQYSIHSYNYEGLPEYLEDRLITSYFQFFKVENYVFQNVKNRLANDFLLLRVFCEVYGYRTNPNPPTEQVYDIFKDDLFKLYFDYKSDQIRQKNNFTEQEFRKLFEVVLKYMIENGQYVNITFNNIDDLNIALLNEIIDEDIFFRKDIIIDSTTVFGNYEVVNFTFDEFRDYLLADFLSNSSKDIKMLLESLSNNNVVREGLIKYLFFKSKKKAYKERLNFIESLEIYDELFLNNIFSVNDEYITIQDIDKVRNLFHRSIEYSEVIISYLMFRHRTNHYKQLNIFTLYKLISELSDDEYLKLVNPYFEIKESRYSYERTRSGFLLDILEEITELLNTEDFNIKQEYHNICELLILLLGVKGNDYDKPVYELRKFLKDYLSKYPEVAIPKLIKYRNINIQKIQSGIWHLFNFAAEQKIEFTAEFCQNIFEEYTKLEENHFLKRDKFFFLEECYKNYPEKFSNFQKIYFKKIQENGNDFRLKLLMGKIKFYNSSEEI